MYRGVKALLAATCVAAMTMGAAGAAFAGDMQKLEYQKSTPSTSNAVAAQPMTLKFSTEAPKGASLPETAGYDPRFAVWETPLAERGVLIGIARASETGPYYQLYVDSNGDGDLSDESETVGMAQGTGFTVFGPVEVRAKGPQGTAARDVIVKSYDLATDKKITITSAGWYEGTVTLGGRPVRCALFDFNSNGTFNDPAADHIKIGLDKAASDAVLGKYVQFEGKLYAVQAAPDGSGIAFAEAGDVPMGKMAFPDGISEASVAGEAGELKLTLTGGAVGVPAGKWAVRSWKSVRKDAAGVTWTLSGAAPAGPTGATGATGTAEFEVAEGKETAVDVGEPVEATISAAKMPGSGGGYSFTQVMKGRAGETVQLTRDKGQPVAPRVRIVSDDGSYDQTFSFQFG